MLSSHTEPTRSQLRWFGLSLAALLLCFAAMARWSWNLSWLSYGLGVAAVLMAACYYLLPFTQRHIIRGFQWITWPIQALVTLLILCILYYLVITPIGIALRCLGRDPIAKSPDEAIASYWQPYQPADDKRRYFRQF